MAAQACEIILQNKHYKLRFNHPKAKYYNIKDALKNNGEKKKVRSELSSNITGLLRETKLIRAGYHRTECG